ncbi:MAG: glycosyltransferase, partial [Rhodanobacteraceae bacterium]
CKGALEREIGTGGFAVRSRVPKRAAVVWHPWNGTFFESGSTPAVATVHDVAPFAFPADDRRERASQQGPFQRTARTARRILADSHFTKDEIERYLDVEPERIRCVPMAADSAYAPGEPSSLPSRLRDRRYLLYVGAIETRKNVDTLVDAWRSAFPQRDVDL